MFGKCRRFFDVIVILNFPDILKKLCPIQRHRRIGKAHVEVFIRKLPVKKIMINHLCAGITTITHLVLKRLADKDLHHAVNR